VGLFKFKRGDLKGAGLYTAEIVTAEMAV